VLIVLSHKPLVAASQDASHGLGLENEWPIILSPDKLHIPGAYDGGYDGVKLEELDEMALITEAGAVPLGLTPYEEDWL
jgi:hypothetical protein